MTAPIVIIGGNGQLGSDLLKVAQALGRPALGLTHAEIDITDVRSIESALTPRKPTVVINTAAAHGAWQSASPAEQESFFKVNALGVWHLARWCWQAGVTLVHYSTDYVYGAEAHRDRPYAETDAPCPTNLYGASKVAGEQLAQAYCPAHYICRIASVYGAVGARAKNDSNFVKTTLAKIRAGEAMQVVNDQWMSPTWTRLAALKTYELLEARAPYGLYHLAGSGACTWYDFAREIVRLMGSPIRIEPTRTPEPTATDIFIRPRYTALDNANLRHAGLADLPHWREALDMFLRMEGIV